MIIQMDDKRQKYYLVVFDDDNALEVLRHEVVMDITFAYDVGLDFKKEVIT